MEGWETWYPNGYEVSFAPNGEVDPQIKASADDNNNEFSFTVTN